MLFRSGLFAAPAEDVGVAALEPGDDFAFFGFFYDELVDAVLRERMVSGDLADIIGLFLRRILAARDSSWTFVCVPRKKPIFTIEASICPPSGLLPLAHSSRYSDLRSFTDTRVLTKNTPQE